MTLARDLSRGTPPLCLARGGRADAPPLVLLHGVTRSHGDFAPLIDRLAAGWRLVAVDHRGHGGSGRAGAYLVVDYLADAVELLRDELREPVVILGHSLGALVAAGVAAAVPELVRGIVLEDPPFRSMSAGIAGSPWQAQFAGMQEIARRGGPIESIAAALAEIRLPGPGGGTVRLGDLRDAAALRWSAACLAELDPEVLTPVIAGRWLDGFDPIATARRIRCRTVLLQADPRAGGALADEECVDFATALPGCRVERFPGSGHLLHWQHPGRVAASVEGIGGRAGG